MRPSPTMRKRSEWEIVPLSVSSGDPRGVSGQSGRSAPPDASIDSVRLTGLQLREKPLWSASTLIPERRRMGRHQTRPRPAPWGLRVLHVVWCGQNPQRTPGEERWLQTETQSNAVSPSCVAFGPRRLFSLLPDLYFNFRYHEVVIRLVKAFSFWQKSHPCLIWVQHEWVWSALSCLTLGWKFLRCVNLGFF